MTLNYSRLRQPNIWGDYQLTPNYQQDFSGGLSQDDVFNLRQQPTFSQNPQIPDIPPYMGSDRDDIRNSGIQDEPSEPSFQDYLDMMNKGYTPSTVDRDRLRGLMDSYPERNKPSFGRKLVASGMSIAAKDPIETTEKVMYAPYMRDVSDWKEKVDPFFKTAELENRGNINERTLMGNAATAYTQNQVQRSRERIAEENTRVREKRVDDQREIGLINANARAAKINGGEVEIDKGSGQVVATYPARNGQPARVEYLGKIPGSSTAAELANITGNYRVQVASALATGRENNAELAQHPDVIISGDLYTWDLGIHDYVRKQQVPQGGSINRVGPPQRPTGGGGITGNPLTKSRATTADMQNEMAVLAADPNYSRFVDTKAGVGKYRLIPPKESGWFSKTPPSAEEMRAYGEAYERVNGRPLSEAPTRTTVPPSGLGPSSIPVPERGKTQSERAAERDRNINFMGPKREEEYGGENFLTRPNTSQMPRGTAAEQRARQSEMMRKQIEEQEQPERTITKREYNPARNQTRITYSDGTTEIVSGRQQ